MLEGLGSGIAGVFGQRPAVFTLDLGEQATQILTSVVSWFATREMPPETLDNECDLFGPRTNLLGVRSS